MQLRLGRPALLSVRVLLSIGCSRAVATRAAERRIEVCKDSRGVLLKRGVGVQGNGKCQDSLRVMNQMACQKKKKRLKITSAV